MRMRGEKVIVRVFGNKPVTGRVWEVFNGGAYVCSEDHFQQLLEGNGVLPQIGFPLEDIFEYQDQVAAELESAYNSSDTKQLAFAWNKARHMQTLSTK